MARKFVIAIPKGGVGKTYLARNLAKAITRSFQAQGKKNARVLLVELDPQGNLTQGFGLRPRRLHATIYTKMRELVRDFHADIRPALIRDVEEHIDLIPANILLNFASEEFAFTVQRETLLKRLLDPIEADYDIIIIDTQPLLGFLVNIAFTWADEVIAPLQAESDAIESAALLLEHLHQLQQVGLNPDLRIAGFLFTQINAQTILHRSGMDFARDAFGRYVNFFESAIPRSTVYPEARARYKSIFEYRPGSRFAQVYDSMAQEVLSGSKSRKVAEMHLTEGFLDEVFEALDDIDEQTAPTPVVIQESHEQE